MPAERRSRSRSRSRDRLQASERHRTNSREVASFARRRRRSSSRSRSRSRSRSSSRSRSLDRPKRRRRSRSRSRSAERHYKDTSNSDDSDDGDRKKRKKEKKLKKKKKSKKSDKDTPETVHERSTSGDNNTSAADSNLKAPDDPKSFFARLRAQEAEKAMVGTVHASGIKPQAVTAVSDQWECAKAGCGHRNSKYSSACSKCGAMKRMSEWR